MIHGEAEDFRGDPSGKLILAHTARRLTEKERTIGSGAPFGTVDVLIKETSDVFRRRAFEFLRDYFPDVPMHRIRHLMNCQIVVCNPEVLLIRNGQAVENVYLVLSGTVEMLRPGVAGASQPPACSSEDSALLGSSARNLRAVSRGVAVPCRPVPTVMRSTLYRQIVQCATREDLPRMAVHGVSCVTLNRLVNAAERQFRAGRQACRNARLILRPTGAASQPPATSSASRPAATLAGWRFPRGRAQNDFSAQRRLPLELVAELPVVRWKLIETHRRRYEGH